MRTAGNSVWLHSIVIAMFCGSTVFGVDARLHSFFKQHCNDCHAGDSAEAGLDLSSHGHDLSDEATFERWERIFDRVTKNEMPPKDADQPDSVQRRSFVDVLKQKLVAAHQVKKGTALRRLNRREYQNTLNDIFGTNLDLAAMLPEDGMAEGFDNIGSALGVSAVHLQRYMDAVGTVLDTAIASTTERPDSKTISASYAETREGEKFIGKTWKKLSDGAVVRFSGGGYPTGMLRGTGVRDAGRYRVTVTGYAHQSKTPITFSVGGTSFARGSEKPIYGFWSFPPGQPDQHHAIEFDAWIEHNYMIAIEPFGISDPQRYQRQNISEYDGPGLAILNVTLNGPLRDQWPSKGHQLIFEGINRREKPPRNPNDRRKSWYKPAFEIVSADEDADAERSLTRVTAAAFRRRTTTEDVAPFTKLFRKERSGNNQFEEALRTAITAVFCSPEFLYLQEPAGRLDDFALASRLSYFLTRTAPDQELLDAAGTRSLTADAAELRHQTERLIRHDHFSRFLIDFTDNWLDLRDIDFTVPDRQLFPEFDPYLRYSMPLETRAFLRELIESNLPVTNLVKSDFAMLNSRLAGHYELPTVTGAELKKVQLPSHSIRGGLLAQAAVLKVTANGTNTSPVTRGAWVMDRILGTPPPPPPPGVPGVEPDIRGASTLRELLKKHRNVPTCHSCHVNIDPPGFALESFDPIGGYRERYRSIGDGERINLLINGRNVQYRLGPPVDASGETPDGTTFSDFRIFRDYLAKDPERLARTLAEKLLTFATGRELGFSDRDDVKALVRQAASKGFGVRDVLHLVVQSPIFRTK